MYFSQVGINVPKCPSGRGVVFAEGEGITVIQGSDMISIRCGTDVRDGKNRGVVERHRGVAVC